MTIDFIKKKFLNFLRKSKKKICHWGAKFTFFSSKIRHHLSLGFDMFPKPGLAHGEFPYGKIHFMEKWHYFGNWTGAGFVATPLATVHKVKTILTKMKSLGPKTIFSSVMCYKSSKIDSCGFVQSWIGVK